MTKGLLIKTDGTTQEVEFPREGGLDEMQGFVGGLIEFVALPKGDLIINEEGKLIGLEQNPRATGLAQGSIMPGDFIAGDAILVGPADDEGYTTDVTQEQLDELAGSAAIIRLFIT